MQTREIKRMLFVGSHEAKLKFSNACGLGLISNSDDYIDCGMPLFIDDNNSYYINSIGGRNTPTEYQLILKKLISASYAVIYLDATPEHKKEAEEIRLCNSKAIAVDFNSLNLSPLECIKKLHLFHEAIDKDFNQKLSLFLSAQKDGNSVFSFLPKELFLNEICKAYDRVASNKYIFFAVPTKKVCITDGRIENQIKAGI